MKIFKHIILPVLLAISIVIPFSSEAQTTTPCNGAIINGACVAGVTPTACANQLFSQGNGIETCAVVVGGQYVTATFSNVDHSAPVVTTSPTCNGPIVNGLCRAEVTAAQTSCVAGSLRTDTNGIQTCQVLLNGQYTTINVCTGTETEGPCRPERINLQAAIEAARQRTLTSGRQCRAEANNFPSIDPNTGLTNAMFYFTICEGEIGFNPTDYVTGANRDNPTTSPTTPRPTTPTTGSNTSTGTTGAGSTNAYVAGMIQLINSFLENARRLYGTR